MYQPVRSIKLHCIPIKFTPANSERQQLIECIKKPSSLTEDAILAYIAYHSKLVIQEVHYLISILFQSKRRLKSEI